MDILYLLIPVSALLVLAIVAIFGWAIHTGQFDDVEREGERLLQHDGAAIDEGQPGDGAAQQQSAASAIGVKAGGT
jgi:cbb3-type cytochrome oxidase maturation protein